MSPPELSVVVPVYNSGSLIREVYSGLHKALEGRNWELIFVDDASCDGSLEELRSLAKADSRVGVLSLASNVGQQNATLCGISQATGRYIANLDDDGQHPPALLPLLLTRLIERDLDLIYAIPEDRGKPLLRQIGGGMRDLLFWALLGVPVRVSSYRVMTRTLALEVLDRRGSFNYFSAMAFARPLQAETLSYPYHPRPEGVSGYSILGRLRLYGNLFWHYGPGSKGRKVSLPAPYPIKERIGFGETLDSGRRELSTQRLSAGEKTGH